VTREAARSRNEVYSLLASDPTAALHQARAIRDPWYRCQALTFVAKAEKTESTALRLVREALDAAREQSEPNRIVSAAAWPLRELVRLDAPAARQLLGELLHTISREPHGLRRLDGTARIVWAVAEAEDLRRIVRSAFTRAVSQSTGWRTERIVASTAVYVAKWDPAFARELIDSREPNRYRRSAEKELRAPPNE
jgi:hypothetical protein